MWRSRFCSTNIKIESTRFAGMFFPCGVLLLYQSSIRSSLVKHLTGIIDHRHMLWVTPLYDILFYFLEGKLLHTSEWKIFSHNVLPGKDRKQVSRILSLTAELLHQGVYFKFEHAFIYLLYRTPRNTFFGSNNSIRQTNIKTTFARVSFYPSLQPEKTLLVI